MNKILVNNNAYNILKKDDSIEINTSNTYDVFNITIKVLKNTNLEIEYSNDLNTKLNINYEIADNVNFHLFEIREEKKIKIQYKYIIGAKSIVDVIKFYNCEDVKELNIINLNGEFSKINYHLKTISKRNQKFDIVVYHNNSNTYSNIVNHGVNIENGSLIFNVTSTVYQGLKGCELNQNNRIITFNDNKCHINPILLIDENDVSANHSAHISKFNDEEIFYLQSRGISKNKAINLLIKGFLLDKLNDNKQINKIIDKYWR